MREFISILKTQLNVYYGISAMKFRFIKKKDLWEIILAVFGIVVGGGSLLFMYIMYLNGIFAVSVVLNQPQLMPTIAILLSQLLTLIFGFLWTISVFYFSDDSNILIPLPVHPYKILLSKYCLILLNEYLTLAVLMFPAIFVYGMGTHAGALYYIISLFVFIFTPVIPLSVAAIVSVLMMRFVNLRRKKDLYTVVISVLIMLFAFGIQFIMGKAPQNGGQQYINNLLTQNVNLAKVISRSFPPALWGAISMTQYDKISGLLNLLMLLTVSVLFTGILMVVAQKMYYRALISGQEFEAKRKKIDVEKKMVKSSILKALIIREWKLFIRVPVYAMNVLPVAIIIPLIFGFSLEGNPAFELSHIVSIASDIKNWFWVTAIGLGISIFVASTNSLSSTAFSREGKMLYISKLIPLEPVIQIKAKWIFGIIMTLLLLIPSYIFAWILLKINAISMLALIVLSLTAISAVNMLSLLIDAIHPMLEWENPQKAMKGNLNVLISMISTILVMGILAAFCALLKYIGIKDVILAIIVEIVFVLLNIVLYLLSLKAIKSLYKGD